MKDGKPSVLQRFRDWLDYNYDDEEKRAIAVLAGFVLLLIVLTFIFPFVMGIIWLMLGSVAVFCIVLHALYVLF